VAVPTGVVDTEWGGKKGGSAKPGSGGATQYQRMVDTMRISNASSGDRSSGGAASSWNRTWRIMCYDVGVAIYIVVFLAWVCYQSVGLSRVVGGGYDGGGGNGCDNVGRWMTNSLILGWVFMMLVCTSFCCSLICLRPV